jgi:hypothetical protein
MSGRGKQRDDEASGITARPKGLQEELAARVRHEQGLSVAPDELGRTWLNDATEQGNFESERGATDDEPASSDGALPGPSFDVDKSVWENTVNLTMQNGADAVCDPFVEDDDSARDRALHTFHDRKTGDIDLTQNSVQDASLFDHETAEPGETEPPHRVVTEASP